MSTRHVYVISDLHLGGARATDAGPSFQMCPPEARRRLARFIEAVRTSSVDPSRADAPRELIINGDLVDFLAEEPFESFTVEPHAGAAKLRQIMRNCDEDAEPEQRVFPALRRFAADGHALTVILGNHDIELALPDVRQAFFDYLTEGRPSRVEFLFEGEACRRGRALIEHGNRYDGWNAVAYGTLRAVRARASRGEPVFPFAPPAGSRLVTQVMNPLKGVYRFIDLLKPENEALIPILSALHPVAVREMRGIFNAWRAKAPVQAGAVPDRETYVGDFDASLDVVPDFFTRVGSRATIAGSAPAAAPGRPSVMNEIEGDPVDEATLNRTEALLMDAEALLHEVSGEGDVVPDQLSEVGDGMVAWVRSGLSLARASRADETRRYQHLRNALAQHRKTIGTTFSLETEGADYLEAANRLENEDTRVVLFGHTHLPKSIALRKGGRYINTGTWCRTIRLDERLYTPGANDGESLRLLREFVEDMKANRVDRWTNLRTPFAHLTLEADGRTAAELCEFHDDGSVSAPFGEFA